MNDNELIDMYILYCRNKEMSETSIRIYKRTLTEYKKMFNSPVLLRNTVPEYVDILKQKNCSISTIKQKIMIFSSYAKYLLQRSLLEKGVLEDIEKLRQEYKEDKQKPAYEYSMVADKDVLKLISYLVDEYENAKLDKKEVNRSNLITVLMAVTCGIRMQELINIKVKNIDIEERCIEVNGRKVYISNNILYEHLCQICKQPHECLLIINHRGDKAFEQGILRALKMACNKANIPECTIKALNNTFIRHLIDGGLYYEEIRSIIGQASFYGCDAVKRIGAENKRNLIFCNAWLNP